jgi:hypothetical protein
VLFDGDLVATPATVTEVAGLDSSGRTELSWLDTLGPIMAGIAGALALIAGVALLVRRPRRAAEARVLSAAATAPPAPGDG